MEISTVVADNTILVFREFKTWVINEMDHNTSSGRHYSGENKYILKMGVGGE